MNQIDDASILQEMSVYVSFRGQQLGPFSPLQLASMRDEGSLSAIATVSTDRVHWLPIDESLVSLRKNLARRPQPLPPPSPQGPQTGTLSGPQTVMSFEGASRSERLAQTASHDVLWPLPLTQLVLLHYLTGGLHTFFWVTLRHGQLPPTRGNDPTGRRAVGLCFVPLYNIYWLFIVWPRLAARVSSLCHQYRMPSPASISVAYVAAVLAAVPLTLACAGALVITLLWFTSESLFEATLLFFIIPSTLLVLGYLLVWPLFACQIQLGINRIFEAQVVDRTR